MKIVLLIMFITISLVGCSTVSDYNQGCRDGVTGLGVKTKNVNPYCDGLDQIRKDRQKQVKK